MTFDNKLSKIVSSLRSNHKAIWNIWESSKWTFFVFIVLTILLHPQIVYIACIRKEVCLSPYTDDPPLSSHPQGNSKSLLDEGWLLNRVHQKLALYLAEISLYFENKCFRDLYNFHPRDSSYVTKKQIILKMLWWSSPNLTQVYHTINYCMA